MSRNSNYMNYDKYSYGNMTMPATPPLSQKSLRPRVVSQLGANMVAAAVSRATSRALNRTATGTREGSSSGVLTFQNDSSSRYVARRFDRRRYNNLKKFNRQVTRVREIFNDSTQQFVRTAMSTIPTAVNVAGWEAFSIGGLSIGAAKLDDDILAAFNQAYAAANWDDSSELVVKNIVFDITMANGLTTATFPTIVDVYHIECIKDVPAYGNGGVFTSLLQFFTSQASLINNTAGGAAAAPITNVAFSVFQNQMFCKYFKIVKKDELRISPAQSATLQIRNQKRFKFNGNEVKLAGNDPNTAFKKGYSAGVLINWHGAPDGTPQTVATQMNFLVTKTISFNTPGGFSFDAVGS